MRSSGNGLRYAAATVFIACMLAVTGGCASVSFKRGASADALGADERACRAETKNEAAFADCMRKRGVYVRGGSAAESTATATRIIAATQRPTPVATLTVAVPEPSPAVPTVTAVPTVGAVPPPPAEVAVPPPSAEEATEEPPAPADPLAKIKVDSWWKLGASAADLDRGIDACVAQLGSAHTPEPGGKIVTAGLRACLRKSGWFAVGTSAAP